MVKVDDRGEKIEQTEKTAKYFTEYLGNGVTLEMVSIPGGKFTMGAPEEEKGSKEDQRPQKPVNIKPFYMGKFEVTQDQWLTMMPFETDREADRYNAFKGEKMPVVDVSFTNAKAFCRMLSEKTGRKYRLPSEAEWEYACRAGTNTPFYFGETITADLANYRADRTYASEPKGKYRGETTPVGEFHPNAFGLYDMHGNVWEWCLEAYNYERLIRGGSWLNEPVHCRSANRDGAYDNKDLDYTGFRVCCEVPKNLE